VGRPSPAWIYLQFLREGLASSLKTILWFCLAAFTEFRLSKLAFCFFLSCCILLYYHSESDTLQDIKFCTVVLDSKYWAFHMFEIFLRKRSLISVLSIFRILSQWFSWFTGPYLWFRNVLWSCYVA
jgi:hypothetical protein